MQRLSYERLELGQRSSWRAFVASGPLNYRWHYHPEIEITVLTTGHATTFVGDSVRLMSAGEAVLIGSSLPHTFVSDANAEAVCAQFDPAVMAGWLTLPEFAPVGRLLERASKGLLFDGSAPPLWRSLVEGADADRTLALMKLLVDLASRQNLTPLAEKELPLHSNVAQRRLEAIMQYLAEDLSRPLVLADVAQVANLTPASTSRFFRHLTGQTMTEYLGKMRVAAACRALGDPTESHRLVAVIAEACGFSNLANFNRTFRRVMGVTPRQFRAQVGDA